jgi:Ca-activated chloride channel homolog
MNKEFLHAIHWAMPSNSIYLWLYAAIILILVYKLYRLSMLVQLLKRAPHGYRFLHNISYSRIYLKGFLWAVAVFIIFLTLLHPGWGKKEQIVTQEGRDLFIALDISASMLAQDVTPNRLTAAKNKIKALVSGLKSERVGLILFAGSSFIQCPLTRDKNAFNMYLDQVDADTISSGTTAIEKPIQEAIQAFKESGTQKNKLLVIFTDGEDFSANLSALKQEAQKEGLTIFTIGIGTEQGAPIPLFDPHGKPVGHLKDKKDTVVITRLNQALLQQVAQSVGGLYIHAQTTDNDLTALITLIEQKEKEKNEDKKFDNIPEQYPWFLLVSFILLAVEWLL